MYVHVGAPLTNSPPPQKKRTKYCLCSSSKGAFKSVTGPKMVRDDQDQGSPIGGA